MILKLTSKRDKRVCNSSMCFVKDDILRLKAEKHLEFENCSINSSLS